MENLFNEKDLAGFDFEVKTTNPGLQDWDNPSDYIAEGDNGETVAPMFLL